MRHEINLQSGTFGQAVVVLLSWGHGNDSSAGAYIRFEQKGISRLEVMQQGSELMAWVDSMVYDNPLPMPFDWVVLSSDLDVF